MELNTVTVNVSADFTTPPGVPPWDERKALLVETLLTACRTCPSRTNCPPFYTTRPT
ncbi:MAG: hypothetical protein IT327_08980 [Anaerolineae bacterium]|nr:hypothetical protein [Anaerolineae bacterium]